MIDTWFRLTHSSIPSGYLSISDGDLSPAAIEFSGNSSLRSFYGASMNTNTPGQGNSSEGFEVAAYTIQQSVIADTLINVAATWVSAMDAVRSLSHGVSPIDDQAAVHVIRQDYYQPYSATNCVRDSISTQNDTRPLSVPLIAPIAYNPVPKHLQNLTHTLNGVPVIEFPPLIRAQLLDIEGSDLDYRIKWFELPSYYFNVSGLGAAIVLPKQYSGATNRVETVVCNLNAGWGPSSINTSYSALGLSATSSLMEVKKSQTAPNLPIAPSDGPVTALGQHMNIVDVAVSYLLPLFPQTTIYIRKEWAEYLNPRIPNLNSTVIDYMMKANTRNGTTKRPEVLSQYIMGALLTNGLARSGADYQFQGYPHLTQGSDGIPELDGNFWLSGKGDFFIVDTDEAERQNWTKLRVDSTIQGYAYNTRGSGPKTAIAFLLMYCTMALAYTAYTGISGMLLKLLLCPFRSVTDVMS